jgi:hypothetical protein
MSQRQAGALLAYVFSVFFLNNSMDEQVTSLKHIRVSILISENTCNCLFFKNIIFLKDF